MLRTSSEHDTLPVGTHGWVTCPRCRRNHRLLRVDGDTEADRLPVYCRTCKTEIILHIERGQSVKRQSP